MLLEQYYYNRLNKSPAKSYLGIAREDISYHELFSSLGVERWEDLWWELFEKAKRTNVFKVTTMERRQHSSLESFRPLRRVVSQMLPPG
jgi:hypothetical protein